MNEPAYHRIAPFLDDGFKRSLAYEGRTGGTYAELQDVKERLSAEIGRVEAGWRLV